jgi:FixJ family two-component response regulator
MPALMVRESQVLELMLGGEPSKRIASVLGISVHAVQTFRSTLLLKFCAKDTPDLVRVVLTME